MARPAKPAVAEEPNVPSSASVLDAQLKDGKDEHFAFVIPHNRIISTGSLKVDSVVKLRSGGVVRLLGKGAELGKTSEGFVLMDNYMKVMPKSKGLYVKVEARLSPEMIARTGMRFVFTAAEWVEGTVFVLPCNIFERMAGIIEEQLKTMYDLGEHLCVMVDSLDMLQLRDDASKNMWGGKEAPKVAGPQLLTKLLFKRIGLPIVHYDALLIATSQYSAEIKLDMYAPVIPRQGAGGGGRGIEHQGDYAFEYAPRYPGDWILEDPKAKPDWQKNKIIGVYATLTIKKSGTDVTGYALKVPIRKGRVGCAIWVEKEITEMLLGWELLKKRGSGSWLDFDPELITEVKTATGVDLPPKGVNGEDNAFRYLEGQPEVVKYLFAKFTKLINGEE